ncbi:MAG: hypothetical protein EAX96_07195 [Candidatus Lokiarchaeota archaeon]|nr:hypothetical protein [Candidatus Lokiarchaeota archaeon]
MSDKLENPKLFFGLALITSIVTAVGLFVSDFGGYYVPYVGWFWLSAGPLLIFIGVLYIFVAIICLLGIGIIDYELPNKAYLGASLFSLAMFIIFIIAGITFAVIMAIDDYEAWFEFAFYAGVIGSPLTGGFLFLGYRTLTS